MLQLRKECNPVDISVLTQGEACQLMKHMITFEWRIIVYGHALIEKNILKWAIKHKDYDLH